MSLLSQSLKKRVDFYCDQFKLNSILFKMGRERKINFYHAASYVINLEHLFFNNANDIQEAAKHYAHDQRLAAYFYEKWNEEKGHDGWARADWVRMSKEKNLLSKPHVLTEMLELTSFLRETMLKSPYEYIAYMFAAEYMTPILGPIWMEILDSNLGIKNSQVTALTKHIELDAGHAMEVGEFLDSLRLSPKVSSELLVFIDNLFEKYNNFFSALALSGELHGYRESHINSSTVSTRA